MGAWYRIIKTIKGHRYVYEQRTRREGKHVRTENRYVGPADDGASRTGADDGLGKRQEADHDWPAVTTTPRILYHGAREGIEGALRTSDEGTFGPGLYLTTAERAERYATLTAKVAANPDAYGTEGPRFDGTVHAVDVGHLKLKVMTWDEFLDRSEALDSAGAATPTAKATLQELLVAEGYDGLDIRDTRRPEMVIFPAAVHKIELRPVTTTDDAPPKPD